MSMANSMKDFYPNVVGQIGLFKRQILSPELLKMRIKI